MGDEAKTEQKKTYLDQMTDQDASERKERARESKRGKGDDIPLALSFIRKWRTSEDTLADEIGTGIAK